MGNLYDFKCEKCDFTTRCSHGKDRGFVAIVQPLYCASCKVLKNIRIGTYVKDESQSGGQKIEHVLPVCKECHQTNTLKVWDGMTCPQCGNVPLLMRDTLICWD